MTSKLLKYILKEAHRGPCEADDSETNQYDEERETRPHSRTGAYVIATCGSGPRDVAVEGRYRKSN